MTELRPERLEVQRLVYEEVTPLLLSVDPRQSVAKVQAVSYAKGVDGELRQDQLHEEILAVAAFIDVRQFVQFAAQKHVLALREDVRRRQRDRIVLDAAGGDRGVHVGQQVDPRCEIDDHSVEDWKFNQGSLVFMEFFTFSVWRSTGCCSAGPRSAPARACVAPSRSPPSSTSPRTHPTSPSPRR